MSILMSACIVHYREHNKELVNISKFTTFANQSKKKWPSRVATLSMDHVIIIGKCQDTKEDDVFHCIARVKHGDKFFLLSPDTLGKRPSTPEALDQVFKRIAVMYMIRDRPTGGKKQNAACDDDLY